MQDYLTPTIENADKKEHGTSTEGSRYGHVHGQVCCPVADVARENRIDCGRIGGKDRNLTANTIRLGVNQSVSAGQRTAKTFRTSGRKNTHNLARKINFGKNTEFCITPIDRLYRILYNARITLGSGLKSLPASRVVVTQSNQNQQAYCRLPTVRERYLGQWESAFLT